MAWYTILFAVVIALFTVKVILSWTIGDLDMDVDFDGIDDFDVSSAFSFKGLFHFLVGFSSYLFMRSNVADIEKINNVAQFSWVDYVYASICGIILMFVLFYAYKLAMKANATPELPSDLINNSKGIIYLNLGNGKYSVEAHTAAGTVNVTANYYGEDNLEPGTEVILVKDKNIINIITE